MTVRNDPGDELTYHGGPLDGQPLNVMAPPGPHDDGYEVRTDDHGMILGAWWCRPDPEQVRLQWLVLAETLREMADEAERRAKAWRAKADLAESRAALNGGHVD